MSIKRVVLGTIAAAVVAMGAISCGGSKTGPQAGGGEDEGPFGKTYKPVCQEFDDDEWFAATGIASGPRTQTGVIQRAALTNGQNIIRQKMQHIYEGLVSDYNNLIGNNSGTDADIHIESAGDQIINAVINDTRTVCGPEFTAPDDKGQVSCFVGIKISKKTVANKMLDKVEDMVSKNEEARIRYNDANFRDKMNDKFKAFKENNSN